MPLRSMRPVFLILFGFGLLLFPTLAAGADSPLEVECVTAVAPADASNALRLSRFGLACFEAGRFDWALTHYLAAYSVHPNPDLRAAIGRSLHELGLYGPARQEYQAFLDAEGDSPAADRIRRRVEELSVASADDGGTLHVTSAPAQSRTVLILDNGYWLDLGATPVEVTLREGTYELVVDSPEHHPASTVATVQPGRRETLQADLIHEAATFHATSRRWRQAGVWTMASSVPIAATGITLLVMSGQHTRAARDLDVHHRDLRDYDDRRREHLDLAQTCRFWGTVGTAIGATGLVAGALFYSAGTPSPAPEEPESAARFRWAPFVSTHQAGIVVQF
jgi:hypothetical protein